VGRTVRRILAEPGISSHSYFFAVLLPDDKTFKTSTARAMDRHNDYWADDPTDIADDGSDDWFETKFGPKFNKEAAERSKIRMETRLKSKTQTVALTYCFYLTYHRSHEKARRRGPESCFHSQPKNPLRLASQGRADLGVGRWSCRWVGSRI